MTRETSFSRSSPATPGVTSKSKICVEPQRGVTHSDSDTETDDLIKNLVSKYSKEKVKDDVSNHEEVVEAVEEEPPKKKGKRTLTPKLKAHLEKQRKVAVEKRKQYAAERRQQKQEENKRKYMAELEAVAEQKLAKVLAKVPQKTRKAPEPVEEETADEATESEESSEEEQPPPKRTKKRKSPHPKIVFVEKTIRKPPPPKPRPTKPRPVKPTTSRASSSYAASPWDDYFMN